MPGHNRAFNQCGTSCRIKQAESFKDKVPTTMAGDTKSSNWRKEFLNVITKYREKDASFKKQLKENTLHVCEKHFLPGEIKISK